MTKPKPKHKEEEPVLLRHGTEFAPTEKPYAPQDIAPNVAIGLGTAAFWRLPSGKMELNSLTGKISMPIPDGLSEDEKAQIAMGLNYRQIKVVDKIVQAEPATRRMEDLLSPRLIQARRITDEMDPVKFKAAIAKVHNADLLDACLRVEKEGLNRKEYITMITAQLSESRG